MWFTNIDHGKRHEELKLMTMAQNLKFNKKLKKKLEKDYGKLEYPHYDNYDAIEVPFTECIPSDYVPCWFSCPYADNCDYAQNEGLNGLNGLCENACSGDMGVPITFLDKYNPEQFDIVKFRKGNDEKDLTYTTSQDTLERNGTERNGTENYALLPDYYPSQDVMDSWESRLPSSTNIRQNNLILSGSGIQDMQEAELEQNSARHTRTEEELSGTDQQYKKEHCISESLSVQKCNGVMGVPITFLDKYNDSQFEIIGEANHGKDSSYDLFEPNINGKTIFKRILVRKKRR